MMLVFQDNGKSDADKFGDFCCRWYTLSNKRFGQDLKFGKKRFKIQFFLDLGLGFATKDLKFCIWKFGIWHVNLMWDLPITKYIRMTLSFGFI